MPSLSCTLPPMQADSSAVTTAEAPCLRRRGERVLAFRVLRLCRSHAGRQQRGHHLKRGLLPRWRGGADPCLFVLHFCRPHADSSADTTAKALFSMARWSTCLLVLTSAAPGHADSSDTTSRAPRPMAWWSGSYFCLHFAAPGHADSSVDTTSRGAFVPTYYAMGMNPPSLS